MTTPADALGQGWPVVVGGAAGVALIAFTPWIGVALIVLVVIMAVITHNALPPVPESELRPAIEPPEASPPATPAGNVGDEALDGSGVAACSRRRGAACPLVAATAPDEPLPRAPPMPANVADTTYTEDEPMDDPCRTDDECARRWFPGAAKSWRDDIRHKLREHEVARRDEVMANVMSEEARDQEHTNRANIMRKIAMGLRPDANTIVEHREGDVLPEDFNTSEPFAGPGQSDVLFHRQRFDVGMESTGDLADRLKSTY